jgi:predicted nucleotidyltransferase
VTLETLLSALDAALGKRKGLLFAVLFGSAATRGPERARDIDIAVSFAHSPSWMELGALASDLAQVGVRDADVVDLGEASTLLRREVLYTGRLIAVPDRQAWHAFQGSVPLEYEDLRPFLERESAGLRRVLEGARWSASSLYARKSVVSGIPETPCAGACLPMRNPSGTSATHVTCWRFASTWLCKRRSISAHM